MKSEKILEAIDKMKQLDEKDLILLEKAIDSFLVVQVLENVSNSNVLEKLNKVSSM